MLLLSSIVFLSWTADILEWSEDLFKIGNYSNYGYFSEVFEAVEMYGSLSNNIGFLFTTFTDSNAGED